MFENEKLGYPKYDDDCKTLIEKFLTICLPVTTTPSVKLGKIKTECCGNPIVSPRKFDKCCEEMKEGCCKFTIIQKMKIEIPIDFDADTKLDDLMVDCEFKPNKYDKCDYDKKEFDICDFDKKEHDKKEY